MLYGEGGLEGAIGPRGGRGSRGARKVDRGTGWCLPFPENFFTITKVFFALALFLPTYLPRLEIL